MRKLYPFFLFLFLFHFSFSQLQAQIATFSFAGSNGDESSWSSSSTGTGVQSTSVSRGSGISAVANADRFNSKGWTTGTSPDLNDYIEFTITPQSSYAVTISTIVLQHQRSVTGPKSFVIRTSLNDFAANATNEVTIPDVNTNQSSTFTLSSPITTTSPLIIRIYAYNAEMDGGTWGPGESSDGNDIVVYGSFVLLPVKFVNVKASWKDKQIEVKWSNATESDVRHYVVERSANGQHFTAIAQLNPTKNDGGMADYLVLDPSPLANANYYRIKAIETNGQVIYSKIVKLDNVSSRSSLSLYPNPVRAGSSIMMQLSNLPVGSYSLTVYNAAAQVVYRETIATNSPTFTQGLTIHSWQKGTYILELRGAITVHQRFLVQ